MSILTLSVITALWILGIHRATWPEMILAGFYEWAETNLPAWAFKPLIGCQVCMASLHTICLGLLLCPSWMIFVSIPVTAGIVHTVIRLTED